MCLMLCNIVVQKSIPIAMYELEITRFLNIFKGFLVILGLYICSVLRVRLGL